MQRYNELYDPYTGALEPDDNGAYVLYEEAQAEIDRLRALLETPRVLKGYEIKEPGFYWGQLGNRKDWQLISIDYDDTTQLALYFLHNDVCGYSIVGRFIGPLREPEVD